MADQQSYLRRVGGLPQSPRSVANAFALSVLLVLSFSPLGNLLLAQQSSTEDELQQGIKYFESEIRPLLVRHCYECHSTKGNKQEGGLKLDSQEGWLTGGDSGTAIVPGDAEASLLIRAIRYQDQDLQMPPVTALPTGDIAKFETWVKLGAPAPHTIISLAADDPSDPIAGKSHWAFQPLAVAAPPIISSSANITNSTNTTGSTNIHNSIDARVLAKLNSESLTPAPEASKIHLMRRLYIQLIGLPPTEEEVKRYMADDSPTAYEQLVDRLLASPHFGERWGRHWLDLARYADSNGLDENFLFREAWRYRNWVIHAISADMPFDAFATQQIAGDLLPFDSIGQRDQQRIAAGFLLLGPKVLLGNDPNNQRMEIADEQIDTIGRVFLGQTLGCARCHNHKFDPIPTRDYYALAGIFTSTQVMEQRFMLNEQRVMEQLVGLGESGQALDDAYEEYWRQRPALGEKKTKAEAALEALKKNDNQAVEQFASQNAEAVSPEAKDTTRTFDQRITAQQSLVDQLVKAWNEPPGIPQRAMIPNDLAEATDEAIRVAGQFDKKGDVVPRGFLSVLCDTPSTTLPPNQSGRLSLAQWLTDPKQRSGQLTARVTANRVWYHLMGRGIVRTVDNFGRTGETPSHAELLDYLAQELMDHDWSIKHLVRSIVLSATFRQSSHNPSTESINENETRDPDNIYFWKYNRRRLDPESFRDSVLANANRLDTRIYDSTVSYLGDQATAVGPNTVRRKTDFPCRSVYLPVIRNDLPEVFDLLDFTDPQIATGMRRQTIVPTQALFLLNDEMIMDASEEVARKALSTANLTESPIALVYRSILKIDPDVEELSLLTSHWQALQQRLSDLPAEERQRKALAIISHALFASSRFQFME